MDRFLIMTVTSDPALLKFSIVKRSISFAAKNKRPPRIDPRCKSINRIVRSDELIGNSGYRPGDYNRKSRTFLRACVECSNLNDSGIVVIDDPMILASFDISQKAYSCIPLYKYFRGDAWMYANAFQTDWEILKCTNEALKRFAGERNIENLFKKVRFLGEEREFMRSILKGGERIATMIDNKEALIASIGILVSQKLKAIMATID